jgi:hypothetical protein
MMGSREPQKQLWSYRVNLDKRVRSDHPLRKLNDVLKLDFVRQEVAKFYGIKGHVSADPAVILKMMLLLFLDDVRSERELMRIHNQHSHSRIHGAPPIVAGGTSLTRPSLKYVVSYVKQNSEQ